MASEIETFADIVAEIRAYGAQPPPRLMWLEIADRIEAAWKRERDGFTWCKYEIDLIAREMRIYARDVRNATDGCSPDVAENTSVGIREFAERLESIAEEVDCGAGVVGNAAAIYAALVKIHDMTNALDEKCGVDPVEIRDLARAALAAPPRQCDVGTAEEQKRRFNMFCKRTGDRFGESAYCVYSCPCGEVDCKLEWAQMPYAEQEGGAE